MKRLFSLVALALLGACQTPPASAEMPNTTEYTLEHDGETRSYLVFVPPQHRDAPRGLIVAMHGGLGTGAIMAGQSGLTAAATRHGFAVAYPDGTGRGWNAGTCCGRPASRKVDDVGFIAAMVATERKRLKLSAEQVFGTGFSNGAMLLHRIACEAPEVFHAIAPVSGGPMFEQCQKPRAITALFIQGREDKNIPWDGGIVKDTVRLSMDTVVKDFAGRNGCSAETTEVSNENGVTCYQRAGCKSTLQWCSVADVGHQWPGGKTILPRLLGANTTRYSAAESIASFFDEQLTKPN